MTTAECKTKIFAIYQKTKTGIMKIVDIVSVPEYYSPTRLKYEFCAVNKFNPSDFWITFH